MPTTMRSISPRILRCVAVAMCRLLDRLTKEQRTDLQVVSRVPTMCRICFAESGGRASYDDVTSTVALDPFFYSPEHGIRSRGLEQYDVSQHTAPARAYVDSWRLTG